MQYHRNPKPFVKRQENDRNDAAAFYEALFRPGLRFGAVLLVLFCFGCSEPVHLKKFGDISVSEPIVSGSRLRVVVVNKTGAELCYFQNGLFYGLGVIEGSTGETEILRPAIGKQPLEEIILSRTNRREMKLVKIPKEGGEVSIEISGQEPLQVGDDLSFDLVFCEPDSEGLHRSLVYSARLK